MIRPAKDTPLAFDGVQYRGSFELAVQGNFIRVVNVAPLDSYLSGVVANEMPHTWPIEALKAQAVAARSYALANVVKGKPFDLYSDVRSQVYRGVAAEKPQTTEAVRATAGQVVLYAGKLATTFYFSTSGGKTASAADVFGTPVPYLLSRPGPVGQGVAASHVGPLPLRRPHPPGEARGRRSRSRRSGRADAFRSAALAHPADRHGLDQRRPSLLRSSLGLRSTWVTIGVLRLDQPRETVVFGSPLRLTGIARSLPQPKIGASPDGSRWTEVGPFQRETSGVASLVVKPERTLRYRIEVEGASSPAVLVEVAPRVQLSRDSVEPKTLAGTVRPRLSGAVVFIERRAGSTWRRVARRTVDSAGAFRTEVLQPGEYRARLPATGGYAEGVTAVLAVAG